MAWDSYLPKLWFGNIMGWNFYVWFDDRFINIFGKNETFREIRNYSARLEKLDLQKTSC
jgi:hypothetical protein